VHAVMGFCADGRAGWWGCREGEHEFGHFQFGGSGFSLHGKAAQRGMVQLVALERWAVG